MLPIKAYISKDSYQLTAEKRCQPILKTLASELTPIRAPWFTLTWLSRTISNAPLALDRAANRWRHLYRSARGQQERQHQIVADPLRSADERKVAQRLREEAETQLDLLTRIRQNVYSDFYSYRYFATEGFLPGYNFPRLPVTAFIPGRLRRSGQDEFLSRARFIAISEFGPRTIVYHEGSRYRVSRVILPQEDGGKRTRTATFCARCGYGHFGERAGIDLCDRCNAKLDATSSHTFSNLLPLQSVSTHRVDRISSDEEERLRLGYEIRTIFRFSEHDNSGVSIRAVEFKLGDQRLATGAYGPATTLWRVNLGWARRKEKDRYGFVLDMERGVWLRTQQEPDASENEIDPLAPTPSTQVVVPFVEDRRNALVLEFDQSLTRAELLSLQYALKRGIEAKYQLEESELASEALPTPEEPQSMLVYEAAEGGAGVLIRLAEQPGALAEVAREALALCHFDANGEDLHRAEKATEDCEAACYDCLLSYSNQRYHTLAEGVPLLDRKLLSHLLLQLISP